MTGTSTSSARSDKSGKKNKNLSLATVKDEFASSLNRNRMSIEHEILKENHETLVIDYESLQIRLKHVEETYEVMKKLLQGKTKELEVTNKCLEEDCEREKSEKDKYKKMFEEMKAMESERKATIDELRTRNQELLLARKKGKEDVEKMENKFVELAEKLGVLETKCSFLKSLYDAEVAASSPLNPVMSGFGETKNPIAHGGNEVNDNVNNDVTDSIMISDDSDDEHDNPPRESKISTHGFVDRRSQEEQCKNKANSSNGNQEIFPPRAVNNDLPLFSPSSSSSSSSSASSDDYEVVVKLPANWPEWAMPKGQGDDSNKS